MPVVVLILFNWECSSEILKLPASNLRDEAIGSDADTFCLNLKITKLIGM